MMPRAPNRGHETMPPLLRTDFEPLRFERHQSTRRRVSPAAGSVLGYRGRAEGDGVGPPRSSAGTRVRRGSVVTIPTLYWSPLPPASSCNPRHEATERHEELSAGQELSWGVESSLGNGPGARGGQTHP